MKSIQLATVKPARTIELHFASGREGSTDENFVVIPPKKEGKLESVEFSDAKLIRRTMGVTNQPFPHEIIQAADPKTGIPPYKLADPNNYSGVGIVRPSLPCS
jgi:hypothetical protein